MEEKDMELHEKPPFQTPQQPSATLQQLLERVKKDQPSEISLKKRDSEAEQVIRERETERDGRKRYFALRDKWSGYLFKLLVIMILFQVVLTFFIGLGWAEFKNYEKFLYLVIGENFLQITGMCIIVVRFLFPLSQNDLEKKP
jgi:hypothetical protein